MRIPVEQQILAVVFSVILLLITVQLVRKHRLREEYALVWLGASLVIFVLTVFDPLVGFLAGLFAVSYPPTLIVVFGVLFCLIILLSQSVLISTQADRIRDLAQSVGLLEWRIHQLQARRISESASGALVNGGHALHGGALESEALPTESVRRNRNGRHAPDAGPNAPDEDDDPLVDDWDQATGTAQ